eukprot:UN15536
MTSVWASDSLEVRPTPYGTVLIIGAWNAPLHLALRPLAGAIAAGNTAILKPSEVTAQIGIALQELMSKYLDTDCYRVVNGGVKETTHLLKKSGI